MEMLKKIRLLLCIMSIRVLIVSQNTVLTKRAKLLNLGRFMRIVIQRTLKSRVLVKQEVVGEIQKGLVLLVCMEEGDGEETLEKAAQKILKLRCFEDPQTSKMSFDLKQSGGEILAISQFTLSWKGKGGNRPGFDLSMKPDQANEMFKKFCSLLGTEVNVETGRFCEYMQVEITNDGPVTFCLDF